MVGVVLWSLGTLVAPPAAKISLLALCASRVFVSGIPIALSCLTCEVTEWRHGIERHVFHGAAHSLSLIPEPCR